MAVRAANRGSFTAGHVPATAVLLPQNAIEIRRRRAEGWKIKQLAQTYGVSETHIIDIVFYRKWKNADQQATQ
jgi:hypothetical protein